MSQKPRAILFFDGDCGLCSRSVRFLMRQDRKRRLRFAPLQGTTAAVCLDESLRSSLSTVVYQRPVPGESTEVLIRSDAVLAALIDISSPWRWLAYPARWIPRSGRDAVYNWVARNRQRFFPKDACALPSQDVHSRLLP